MRECKVDPPGAVTSGLSSSSDPGETKPLLEYEVSSLTSLLAATARTRAARAGSSTSLAGALPAATTTTIPLLTIVLTCARVVGSMPGEPVEPMLMFATLMLCATRCTIMSSRAVETTIVPPGKTLAPAQRDAGATPRSALNPSPTAG